MSLEYEQGLSLEELKRRNRPAPPPAPTAPETHPTAEEWERLNVSLTAIGELLAEQIITLERQPVPPSLSPVLSALRDLIRATEETNTELREIKALLRPAGRKRERWFSLPRISLPRIPLPDLDGPTLFCLLISLAALVMLWLALGGGWKLLMGLLP